MKTSIYTLILEFLKKILITSFVLLLVLQETKSKNIESKTIFELQNVLKEISQKNNTIFFEKTLKVVKNSYDAEKMIKMIVAGRWSKISDDKKKKLVQVFEKYIAMNYLKMFQKIVNPSFKISSEKKIGKNYKLVKTHLILKNNEQIEINYLLTKKKK